MAISVVEQFTKIYHLQPKYFPGAMQNSSYRVGKKVKCLAGCRIAKLWAHAKLKCLSINLKP